MLTLSPPASHKSRGGTPALSDRLQIAIQIHHLPPPQPEPEPSHGIGGKGRAGRNIRMGGEHHGHPITQHLAGTIACRALRDPWPPATPRALQPTTLYDRALACPPCCKPTATSRRCAASFDESQSRRGLPCSSRPALPCHMCLCACVPLSPRWGRPPRASRPHWHIFQKRKVGIGLLSGCMVPTPALFLASASLRYQQPLYTLLPLL